MLSHIQTPPSEILSERLQLLLADELPGKAAQYEMAHLARKLITGQDDFSVPDNHRKAAVLILLYPKEGQWHTVLMLRPEAPYAHSRQVSFPGGKLDDADLDLSHTALREAEEELGIPPASVRLLGALTELYIPVSYFLVQPYLGICAEPPAFVPNPSEVETVIETPLHLLMDKRVRKKRDLLINKEITLEDVPYFDVFGHTVWGATAMMLAELVALLERIPYIWERPISYESR